MPSKHFFTCGWTRIGSLVSDKISNSSSLERKKNLKISAREIFGHLGLLNERNKCDEPGKEESLLLQVVIQALHDCVQEFVGLVEIDEHVGLGRGLENVGIRDSLGHDVAPNPIDLLDR